MTKRIMGIDPGFQNTGMAILEETNNVITLLNVHELKLGPIGRLKNIFHGVTDIINSYKPDIIIVEKTLVCHSVATSLKLGQARGVILLACELSQIHYEEVSPMLIKKVVTGNGKNKKEVIQAYIETLFNIHFEHNAADAVMIALYHWLSTNKLENYLLNQQISIPNSLNHI